MSDSAWALLERHNWPGNVRELGNLMERVAIYHSGKEVHMEDLGLPVATVALDTAATRMGVSVS